MALRFLLGMAEAAFGPGTPYLLSFFYRRHELGLRCGMFVSAAPLANTFAGALAYGITSGHSKLANWRLLFLVEGSPSLIAAVIAWYFLPDHPSTARFLTEEEKEVARARGMRRSGESERSTGIDWRDVGRTVLDAKAWLTALMYFSCNVSFSSLPVFLPTILEEMGFSSINAQGLTAPPYFASFLVTLATTWVADRFQQRGLTIAICSVVGAVGYTLLATSLSVGVRYLGVFLAAAGVFPCIANILPWVLSAFSSPFLLSSRRPILMLYRQPRLRHAPRRRHCHSQPRRAVRPFPWHECIPGQGRPAVRSRPGHLRGLHVLHDSSRARAAGAPDVGESAAGSTAWNQGRARGSWGTGARRYRGRGELRGWVPICVVTGWIRPEMMYD